MAGSNSPFSSGSGVSSILRAASSRAQKIQDYNDALVSFEFDNSSKTYADYLAYEKYLKAQIGSTGDPMAQLTYTKKINSARSGYISNEIQRQTIDVIEGQGSNVDKYNKMLGLFYQAANAGQYDLAQSLHLQLDNLSVTIQNEAQSAAAAGRAGVSQAATDIKNQVADAVDQIKQNASFVTSEYQRLGPDEFQKQAGSDIFSMLYNMVSSKDPDNPGLLQIYKQASSLTPNPSDARGFQTKFNDILGGAEAKTADGTPLFSLPGVDKVSVKDLQDQIYANSIGQSLYDTVETAQGVQFKKNVVTGYQYGRDETGAYKLMPIYGANQDFSSNLDNPKKKDSKLSYSGDTGLLSKAGFEVTQSSGSNLTVRNNGEFDKAGVARGQQVQLYVDASGNLQVVNGDKAFTLGFDGKTGKYTGLKESSPNYINALPNGNQEFSRFNNRFFAQQLAKDPNFFGNLPAGSIGLLDMNHLSFQPGMLLDYGVRRQQQIEIQRAALAAQVQRTTSPQPSTYNPQRTISPLGLPSNTRLTIAQPQPLPTLTVAKPKPLPSLTVTSQPSTGGFTLQGFGSSSGGFSLQG